DRDRRTGHHAPARRRRAAAAGRPRAGRPVRAVRPAGGRRDGHGLPRPGRHRPGGRGQGRAPGAGRGPRVPGPVRRRGGRRPPGRAVLHRAGGGRRPRGRAALPGHRVRRRGAAEHRGRRGRAAGRVHAARRRAGRRGRAGRGARGRGGAPRPQARQRAAVAVRAAGDRLRHRPGPGRGPAAHPGGDAGRHAGLDGAGAVPRRGGRPGLGHLQLGQPGHVRGDRAQPVAGRVGGAVAAADRAGVQDPARRAGPDRARRPPAAAGGVGAGQGPGPAADRPAAGGRAARVRVGARGPHPRRRRPGRAHLDRAADLPAGPQRARCRPSGHPGPSGAQCPRRRPREPLRRTWAGGRAAGPG
ncbi:MAG: putative serine/threonine protein kinase, partial [uncultured Corynebacteriales bacterium]